ncbi:MAG: ABC transporter permease [Anaerolineae bacterium]|nr:ABC transporter permease [Anaerolineae bacterium]
MVATTKQTLTLKKGRGARRGKESIYYFSQWQLMWLKFTKHKLAVVGGIVVCILYLTSLFHPFLAPYNAIERTKYIHFKPQKVHFFSEGRLTWPFVYDITSIVDPVKYDRIYVEDTETMYPINFFVRRGEYKLFGVFKSSLHLFGVPEGGDILLLGTDELGRDMFSRVLYGSAISLSIGLVGVFLSFILGIVLGGVSGYYSGVIDTIIQRVIEFLLSMPTIPLWMALSVAIPTDWPATKTYFAITIILSLRGWCGLARVVRGKLLETREEDFVMAAKLLGSSDIRVILRHMLPTFLSYLIVDMTLAIPGMILGETTLSFLGLGLRPPVVSWGVLLQKAINIRVVATYPWLMIPAIPVIFTVLAFNFMGDGLRDAADPYK